MTPVQAVLGEITRQALAKIKRSESMRTHTTFRCEAVAQAIIYPADDQSFRRILKLVAEHGLVYKTDWDILGRGSNLLVRDGGFPGILVDLSETYRSIDIVNEESGMILVSAGAGVANGKLLQFLRERNLSGFGFSFGIPGSIGGGIRMNAGTPLGWFSHILLSVRGFGLDALPFEMSVNENDFVYRDFPKGHKLILTGAVMKFKKGNKTEIEMEIENAKGKRVNQPLEFPNIGSVFKNPEGTFAAKLVEELGFKGKRRGDAEVSQKHSNFIINRGHAKTSDVLFLMNEIQTAVFRSFGIHLEPEVKLIGVDA